VGHEFVVVVVVDLLQDTQTFSKFKPLLPSADFSVHVCWRSMKSSIGVMGLRRMWWRRKVQNIGNSRSVCVLTVIGKGHFVF